MFLLVLSLPAHAQSPATLDQIVGQFQAQSSGWQGALQGFALHTFGILALIEMGWAGVRLAFRGADLAEWLAEVVNQIMFIGFFLALLQNSVTWMTAIVSSFRQAAGAAGGGGIMPSSVFAAGVTLAGTVMSEMSLWSPAASVSLAIAGLTIEVCFALIAAFMILALVESYLVISMGVIFMAFGGSRWTKDIAISTVRYALSVGAKLFVMQLLVGIGQNLIMGWAANFTAVTANSMCILIGCAIVLLALVKILPETVQRMVNGSSMASGSALVGAAAAVGYGSAAFAAGVAGAAPMAFNAARLAGAQTDAADAKAAGAAEAKGEEAPERSRLSRAATITGRTALNMGQAATADVGRRLSGQGSRHGLPTWRMSADLGNRARLLRDDNNRPLPGGSSAGSSASGGPIGGYPGGQLEPWMTQGGGFGALSAEHQASARRSYERWGEENPQAAARHGLDSYVGYVQEKQAERIGGAVPANTIS